MMLKNVPQTIWVAIKSGISKTLTQETSENDVPWMVAIVHNAANGNQGGSH